MSAVLGLAALPVLLLGLPALALLLLTLAALGRREPDQPTLPGPRPPLAVLVPAHNESAHLAPTLANLRAQLQAGDRLLVVADNCDDDTALCARRAGAEVVERQDRSRRGKGHALAFGVAHLAACPPGLVVVVDADCALSPGSLERAARACHALQRPVQMLNLMQAPEGSGLCVRVLEFAMRMKNLVRPLGTRRLGDVCHLTGTGMALPWALLHDAPLATGHLAEDMKLGLALAARGHPTRLLPEATLVSAFVRDRATARGQKSRWEHGSLDTLREELPGLLGQALRRRSRALAVLALDLMIPPIALYTGVLLAATGGLLALALVWPALWPLATLAGAGLAALAAALLLGWWCHGRDLLRPLELCFLPRYLLWKLPVYLNYLLGARSAWSRTRREPARARVTDGPGPAP